MHYMAYIIKYTLYIFNIIFVVCGILLIISGSIMLSKITEVPSLNRAATMEGILILLILLGCIVSIVSFLACCGAIREHIGLMTTYTGIMFILLFIQIVLVILIFAKHEQFLESMGNTADSAWEENINSNGYSMDLLQITFECCGLYSFEDYNESNQTVPFSCCGGINSIGICPEEAYITKPGCRSIFVEFWASKMNLIRYSGIGVVFVEIISICFACYFISSLRKQLFWYYGQHPTALWEICWKKIYSGVAPHLAQVFGL